MIFYALHVMNGNPQGGDDTKMKVYASIQSLKTLDLMDLATHIANHNSKYHRADVYGVLLQLVDCIYEQLLQGYRVGLGQLGTLYCTLSCEGADTLEEFSTANFKKVNVNWRRGEKFETIINDAEFMRVNRRDSQDLDRDTEMDRLRVKLGVTTSDGGSSSDSSTDSGTSDSGGTGGDTSGSGGTGEGEGGD
ncbi:MAG: hypothetical protein LUI09_05515 [Prevotellaceae bacterium]|nr:hypothetical protein [Prevotellaceae bacterium]